MLLRYNTNRIYGLDIVRAVAILSVMFSHAVIYVTPPFKTAHNWLAFDGVTIFFVLSGFLIGGILIRTLEKKAASIRLLWDFWLKRWIRTIPPYLLVLLLLCVLDLVHYSYVHPDFRAGLVWKYFFFLQNLRSPHPIWFQEAWSLSVEEWFYLLTAPTIIALVAARLKPQHAVPLVAIIVLGAVTAYRFWKFQHIAPVATIGVWEQEFRKIVLLRLDSLMYGVLGAYWAYYRPSSWARVKGLKLALGIALLLLLQTGIGMSAINLYSCVFSFSVGSFAALLLLPAASQYRHGSGVLYRIITHISLISYSMYLLNATVINMHIIEPTLAALQLSPGLSSIIGYVCFWLFTLAAATAMYQYFEVPVMALRNKLLLQRIPKQQIA